VRAIFPPNVVAHLRGFLFCGNYGDPMVAHDLLPILVYLRSHNPSVQLKMNTNGSGRTPAFWRELAGLLTSCTFSIDGLADTNAVYRRGTDWVKIIKNVESYIAAGGRAIWDFIVFRHNEHQVEEARALSQTLGFRKFTIKKTSRFQQRGRLAESLPVLESEGVVAYRLEIPRRHEYRNDAIVALDQLAAAGQYDSYLDTTEIDCKAVTEQQIYVNADGAVLPCCWLGALHNGVPRHRHEVWRLIQAQPDGLEAIDAKRRPLQTIVEGPLFQHDIPAAWKPGRAGYERLKICAKVCGRLDARSAMYS
jgi:MoaA/NifB/PqqE/SkfB family radical SAM enzyme